MQVLEERTQVALGFSFFSELEADVNGSSRAGYGAELFSLGGCLLHLPSTVQQGRASEQQRTALQTCLSLELPAELPSGLLVPREQREIPGGS